MTGNWEDHRFTDQPPAESPRRKSQRDLLGRVVKAAECALADHSYVSCIDVLCGMGLLPPGHVDSWRKGQVDFLERAVQGNPHKISSCMAMFRRWGLEKGLTASETHYVRRTRNGTIDLRFSKSGESQIEKNYRTHFVSPALSERKRQQLQAKLDQAPQTVVFQILRNSQCCECGAEIEKDSLLYMEADSRCACRAAVSTTSNSFPPATRH